jgi:hypothetical protein
MERRIKNDEIYWKIFERTGSIQAFLAYLLQRSGMMKRHPADRDISSKAVKEISRPA